MDRIAFIYGELFLYWGSIVVALAAAAAVFLFLSLYIGKSGNGTAAVVALPLAIVFSLLLGVVVSLFTAVVVTRFLMKQIVALGVKNVKLFTAVRAEKEEQE